MVQCLMPFPSHTGPFQGVPQIRVARDQVGDHILHQEEKALPKEDVERLPEMPWNPLFQQKITAGLVLTTGGWLNLNDPTIFQRLVV